MCVCVCVCIKSVFKCCQYPFFLHVMCSLNTQYFFQTIKCETSVI